MRDLINTFCAFVFMAGFAAGGSYEVYKFVRREVTKQCQKGLPSLEKFSRQLTKKD